MKCSPTCYNCRGASCINTPDEIDEEHFNDAEILLPDKEDVLEDLLDDDYLKLD
ncbi:unnamed protein product [Ceutorhynchus assimilis]|uniref:Uncharacterized protein n=1 Tax=Ceutorhynchus assimilis TaxID=467358 RepID=A0A9N9MRW6_9CUCU|nr:unnamed protein product [Ceutorhynchus assimilis]